MDREKVIKGLYACTTVGENGVTDGDCKICPYDKGYATGECWLQMNRDALALLKEQEAVEPVKIPWLRSDGSISEKYRCGSCDLSIFPSYKFCPFCGRSVKWE